MQGEKSSFTNVVHVIASIALVIVTLLYLIETFNIRKIAEEALIMDNSPKVFLGDIKSIPSIDKVNKKIDITTLIVIKNSGQTQANDFEVNYTLKSGNGSIDGKIGPFPYLFKDQGITYPLKMFTYNLTDNDMYVLQEAEKSKQSLSLTPGIVPPIVLNLNIKYQGLNEKQENINYEMQYSSDINGWFFLKNSKGEYYKDIKPN